MPAVGKVTSPPRSGLAGRITGLGATSPTSRAGTHIRGRPGTGKTHEAFTGIRFGILTSRRVTARSATRVRGCTSPWVCAGMAARASRFDTSKLPTASEQRLPSIRYLTGELGTGPPQHGEAGTSQDCVAREN